MNRVFVYGTLRREQDRNDVLEKEKFVTEVIMKIPFKMVNLGSFPGLIFTGEINQIKGEIYEVSKEALNLLDQIEGHPTFYQRIQMQGTWFYILPSKYSNMPEIASGDWLNR